MLNLLYHTYRKIKFVFCILKFMGMGWTFTLCALRIYSSSMYRSASNFVGKGQAVAVHRNTETHQNTGTHLYLPERTVNEGRWKRSEWQSKTSIASYLLCINNSREHKKNSWLLSRPSRLFLWTGLLILKWTDSVLLYLIYTHCQLSHSERTYTKHITVKFSLYQYPLEFNSI